MNVIETPLNNGIHEALQSLLADRLSVLAGAGLSMPPPSCLPSAAALAQSAKEAYEAKIGMAPFGNDIAEQADYFFRTRQLESVYLGKLINKNAFAGHPNLGHFAVADLVLINALKTAVTTNIDTMIETAGQLLFGQIETGIDAQAMARVPADESPLLKIHGCRQAGLSTTVWSALQLDEPVVHARLMDNANWLSHRLANRDLLIVGYATDWDYINQVLDTVLGTIAPALVIIVDPSDEATLRTKAPELIALGNRASVRFLHVRCSGEVFLDSLRLAFSQSFIRQVLHSGRQLFEDLRGAPPDPNWLAPPTLTAAVYWQMRRDLEGCIPRSPAKSREPTNRPLLGMTLLRLRAAGAEPDGSVWRLGNNKIRVINAEGKALHRVKAEFDGDMPPIVAPDIVIAFGSADLSLPTNIARGTEESTIARGDSTRWLTREQAEDELHI